MTNAPISDPLIDCLIETERHVAAAGWERPPRLFALVRTARLVEMEPGLAGDLRADDPAALSSVEQDGVEEALGAGSLGSDQTLDTLLASLAWPDDVEGVALAVERLVLPPSAANSLPEDPGEIAEVAAAHPDRVEVRLMAGVTRDGASTCLLRQREHDADDQVAIGHDIAPGLLAALAATLVPETD